MRYIKWKYGREVLDILGVHLPGDKVLYQEFSLNPVTQELLGHMSLTEHLNYME